MNRTIHAIDTKTKLTVVRMDVDTFGSLRADDAPECNRAGFKKREQTRFGTRSSWFGGIQSLADARRLFAEGWQEGAERAESLKHALAGAIPAGTITRRRRTTGDTGDDIRMDAVLSANWDHAYTRRDPARVNDPSVISIAAGWIAPASTSHENLIWNALQAIALTDALEQAGYRVELRALDGTQAYKSHNYTQLVDVTVKRAEEPLRADLVAAMIGHAGVYRTLGFQALWCSAKQQEESMGHCLYAEQVKGAVAQATAAGMIPSVSYVLPRADSAEAARANIRAAVAALFGGATA